MEYHTHSDSETISLGKTIASQLHGGDIVLLSGDLGAGKTTLVKGIATGLGITGDITSPTFTLMNVYPVLRPDVGMQQFVHIDTYRLKNEQELRAIGVTDYLGDLSTVCLIEWPEKIRGLLSGKKCTMITMDHESHPNERKISTHQCSL